MNLMAEKKDLHKLATTSFRLPKRLLERLKAQADGERRKQTEIVKKALEEYFVNHPPEQED